MTDDGMEEQPTHAPLTPPANPGVRQDVTADMLEVAAIGAVLLVPDDRSIPSNWHETDGSRLNSKDYPEFARWHHLSSEEFELPMHPAFPGYRMIVKLGS